MSVLAEKQTHLSGHKWHISRLEFSPGGLHLASSSWDKTVRIWDLSTLNSVFVLRHHRNPVTSIAWQHGGAAAGCLGILASGSADSTVALCSGETGKLLQSLAVHNGWVLDVSFSNDGVLLASCSWDKSVCLSDPRTGQLLRKLTGHTTGVWTCAFQSVGSAALLCSGADDGSLKIWDSRAGNSVLSLVGGHDDTVKCCAWSPDCRYIASGSADCKIALWEPRSGTLLSRIRGHEDQVNEIQFYPVMSSKSVPLIFTAGDNTCRVWHPLRKRSKQLQMIKQHRLGLEVEALCLSPDGTLLATGARDKDIILSSLDVSLTEVDALPIEDQNEAAINYGATLWKKYTRKVLQRVTSELAAEEENNTRQQSAARNTASLVGCAVHKTGVTTTVVEKEGRLNHVEVNGNSQSGEILKEQRARLRKSSRPETSNGTTDGSTELEAVRQHLKHVALNKELHNGHDSGYSNGHSDVDLNGNGYTRIAINSHNKEHQPVYDNGDAFSKQNGYQSQSDSSTVSSSSYYGDIEDVAREMYELANQSEDARF